METEEALTNAVISNATDQDRARSVQETLAKVKAELGEVTEAEDEAVRAGAAPRPDKEGAEAKPKDEAKKVEKAKPEKEDEVTDRDFTKGLKSVRARYARKEEQLEASYQQKIVAGEQRIQQAVTKYKPLHDAAEAFDSGDLDGFAEAIARYKGDDSIKDWNALQQAAIQAHANPAIREVRKLRRENEAKERNLSEANRLHAQRQQQEQAQAAQKQWIETLADDLTSDEDAALPAILEVNPEFTQFVFAEQDRHFKAEETRGEVLPAKEAAEVALRQLYAKWKSWGDIFEAHKDSAFLKKIFGDQAAAKKPASGTGNRSSAAKGKEPQKRVPPAVSQNRTAEASAYGRPSDDDLKRKFARQMDEAARADPMFRRTA